VVEREPLARRVRALLERFVAKRKKATYRRRRGGKGSCSVLDMAQRSLKQSGEAIHLPRSDGARAAA